MKCPHCGKDIFPKQFKCHVCGKIVDWKLSEQAEEKVEKKTKKKEN